MKPATWQSKLLAWYRKNRRDLPWRRTKDPYAIWVSEIMLQQTTVEAVIPYYERFLKRFPTVKALAAGSEEDVLRLWSGLGYYSRARNLHRAAGMIVELPGSVEELMKLPGIGRYTAGAIASIAFGRKAPIVDGNVIRVLSRIFAIREDPKSSAGQKVFWGMAQQILPHKHCGDFNQAVMELGATVCSPENPSCLSCPVSTDCLARKKGRPEEFPKGKKRTEYRDVLMVAAVVRKEGRILFVRRPQQGLLRGMWELPMVTGDSRDLGKDWPVDVARALPMVRHSVLNRRLKILPFLCELRGTASWPCEHRWTRLSEVDSLPTSSMNRKILKHLRD
ncbi:MAG TPA: A/G-specific adenine glycosylase [bacterium]|nr:A/G-specific adenine glycosylase [bacterium]